MSARDRLLSYLPRYYGRSDVVANLIRASGSEIDALRSNLQSTEAQLLTETATDIGLARREHILKLPYYAGEPFDQRRSRIIAKARGIGTVTDALIKQVAESYVYGAVEVEERPDLSFVVRFIDTRGIPAHLDDLKAAIREIKPAHLTVIYEFTYTTWGEVKATTWATVKTGTWGELKTRVIV